ncbi:hypothetical protein QEN19_003703 [Hanseniaspora menglaensis]
MRTDYGTLKELLAEIGLPSTKATGLYDAEIKPPYSYAAMIALSIMVSGLGQLTLSQIYQWISTHFPFYKLGDSGWQNSIRHNLSLNSAFFKGGKSSDGKGHFWRLTPGQELKILKIQAKPSTKHKSKKVQTNVKIDPNFDNDALPTATNPLYMSNNISLKLMDSIKEDDTLVSSASPVENKQMNLSSNQDSISLRVEDVYSNYKSLKKQKYDHNFGEKYNELLTTPVKYKFIPNSNSEDNYPTHTEETNENMKSDFNILRKTNDLDDFNSLITDGKFMELEQSFQCSFNTSFDSPKLANNFGSSPLIEYHSKSKNEINKANGENHFKMMLGRTATTLVETPRKHNFNDELDDDKYGKIAVGNVMLSRTPLKPAMSPFPAFSLINTQTGNHLNAALQKNTPRWKTPSYDDFFVSPFFKSPRANQFSSGILFSEHTITNNNHASINLEMNRRHSTTEINDLAYEFHKDNSTAKKLEPALLDLKGSRSSNGDSYGIEKNSDDDC